MCTYNGATYLRAQLDSFGEQTYKNWRLIVSDDGSTDDTIKILEEYRQRWGSEKIEIRRGPNQGFCQNFLSLAIDPAIRSDFFAFSDQDDVWLPEKLEVALATIDSNSAIPFLYCGRTSYVKDDLQPYAHSPLLAFPGTFRNALVQSMAGGNTMVFNRSAKRLLEAAGRLNPVSHDWWLYQLVSGSGGRIYYDPNSHVLYRQHPRALVGGNSTLWNKFERVGMLMQGRFKNWTDQNLKALVAAKPLLTHDSLQILELFIKLRHSTIKNRFRMLEVCGLYRQTWRGTVSLIFAALTNKL
jgi:glycosyltransferase involved in cell wall biosynthesis